MNPEVHPAHILRSYLWELLKANDPATWDESKYGGMIPVVALNEEPELSEYTGPHIVYGYADDGTGTLHARKVGSMTLAVYDNNNRRLGRTMRILTTAFERQDEAAKDVNDYSDNMADSGLNGFLGLTFGYIAIGFAESGAPEEGEETEGGRQSALINLRYEYHVDYSVNTRWF
jgi:hypothetical protein